MAQKIIANPFPVNQLVSLAAIREPHAVSIYLPMDIKGSEQNRHLAQGRLKNCLLEVARALSEFELPENEVRALLEPAEQLLDDPQLWRNPVQTLALFLSPRSGLRRFMVPLVIEQRTFVGGHYLLSPLLALYQDDGQYYLLELSRDYVKLYEASRFQFRDLHLEEDTPVRLEEAIGFDFQQKNLHYHTGKSAESAIIHGHAKGKDDSKKELSLFLKKVHEGVLRHITSKQAPLVLSCVDELASVYRNVNRYPTYFPKNLSGDPEFKSLHQRHQESWELVQPYFEDIRKRQAHQYLDLSGTSRVSQAVEDIIPAAVDGKIATLYIRTGEPLYGRFDSIQKSVHLDKMKTIANTSLSDLAAMNTFLQGGKVYFVSRADMPDGKSIMNAIYRF